MPEPTVPAPIATVRGEAQLAGPPDLATLSVTLHASGEAPAAVRAALATGSAEVAELVDTFADAVETWSTSGLHVGPVYSGRKPPKITGYTGTLSSELVVHDFDALSPIVLAASELTGSRVSGPWWSLRHDNPIHRQVRIAAIRDARTRAEDYAGAFDGTVAGLVEVSDLESGFAGRTMDMLATGSAGDGGDEAEIDFEPEPQTVYGQITVRFALRIGGVPER
jgi:uncharacterized protein YggE